MAEAQGDEAARVKWSRAFLGGNRVTGGAYISHTAPIQKGFLYTTAPIQKGFPCTMGATLKDSPHTMGSIRLSVYHVGALKKGLPATEEN